MHQAILFSKILDSRNNLKIPIDIIAAGIEAEMVIPAYNPKYAIAEESTIDKRMLKKNAFTVISCFIDSTYKLSMQKNNHISFLTLIAMLFMSMQTFHHHDSNFSNNKLLNHDTESLINNGLSYFLI